MFSSGDPSMKSGNGIPARCVYLEEMAADLDDQDWLDMENIEQVRLLHVSLLTQTDGCPDRNGVAAVSDVLIAPDGTL